MKDKFFTKKPLLPSHSPPFNFSSSALIMCRPQLKGFFDLKLWDHLSQRVLEPLLTKKEPFCVGKIRTPLGESYLIMLSYSTAEMKQQTLSFRQKEVLLALKLAESLKVESISFAGLLPSLLNHFKPHPTALCPKRFWPEAEDLALKNKIQTGHLTTSLALAWLFDEIVKECPYYHTFCLLGVGSIGQKTLKLLLEKVLKPKKILLCDLRKKEKNLLQLAKDIQTQYQIPVEICYYNEESFLKIYQADLMLGAVSSKRIINPDLLKKGSILIDDSFPPMLSISQSLKRMKSKQDVLILTGGKLDIGAIEFSSHLKPFFSFLVSLIIKQLGIKSLPGCWAEALLSAKGLLSSKDLIKIWEQKETKNIKPAKLHLLKYNIPNQLKERVYKLRSSSL